jgi:hypothetical protein
LVASFSCGPFGFVEPSPFGGGGLAANVGSCFCGERCFPRYSELVEYNSCFIAFGFGGDDIGVAFGFRWFDDELLEFGRCEWTAVAGGSDCTAG